MDRSGFSPEDESMGGIVKRGWIVISVAWSGFGRAIGVGFAAAFWIVVIGAIVGAGWLVVQVVDASAGDLLGRETWDSTQKWLNRAFGASLACLLLYHWATMMLDSQRTEILSRVSAILQRHEERAAADRRFLYKEIQRELEEQRDLLTAPSWQIEHRDERTREAERV
jgi:hypothetical protein